MGSITRTLGRLLFVTILISSAYLHLNKPQTFVESLSTNYKEFAHFAGKEVIRHLPPPQNVLFH